MRQLRALDDVVQAARRALAARARPFASVPSYVIEPPGGGPAKTYPRILDAIADGDTVDEVHRRLGWAMRTTMPNTRTKRRWARAAAARIEQLEGREKVTP